MIRRHARQRKEYLYRKAQQLQEQTLIEKRQQLSAALASGKPLSRELADDKKLQQDYLYDESVQDPTSSTSANADIDDEYAALSGLIEPKLIITTSRNPSSRLSQFTKEIKLLFPNSIRLNRGNYVMSTLVETCRKSGITDLIVIHEHRGVPTTITINHLPHGPTLVFSLHNVVLRHDILNAGNVSEVYPHLIFENFSTKLGLRVVTALKHCFPPGVKLESPRVVSFINQEDFISVRQHLYVKTKDDVEVSEVGPRFEMRLFEVRLGCCDDKDADVEWMLRRFVRTGNRKNVL
ncbi:unnamed protein product [Ambrosiozyma monospora]|uniref:U3 small nucleolar ribonucleoprotein protein IMP4 n=1 Tax=Ambrosiozyma monospora TaxID=43982 RepID=A0A9W6Z1W1_AMBMO|nr:unnamed protein product [Ambrosiozyma monospora]